MNFGDIGEVASTIDTVGTVTVGPILVGAGGAARQNRHWRRISALV